MLEKVYQKLNRNRCHPCVGSKEDMFRILQYDINSAAAETERVQPLLLTRHNVVPGMVLIYCCSKLLFCDHIFNGYGCTEEDFRRQLRQCHIHLLRSFSLPSDFLFIPAKGKKGKRSPWGGEISGAGVDYYGSPGLDNRSKHNKETTNTCITLSNCYNTDISSSKKTPNSTTSHRKIDDKLQICRKTERAITSKSLLPNRHSSRKTRETFVSMPTLDQYQRMTAWCKFPQPLSGPEVTTRTKMCILSQVVVTEQK